MGLGLNMGSRIDFHLEYCLEIVLDLEMGPKINLFLDCWLYAGMALE